MTFKLGRVVRTVTVLGVLYASASDAAAPTLKVPLTSKLAPNFAGFYNSSAPLTNAALKVVTSVQTGDDQTFSDILIDTGSAILWVGGQEKYIPGNYTHEINQTFSVGYGTGGVSGTAYVDRVTIGTATVDSQIIGDANYTDGFTLVEPLNGIIGLGPVGSNYGEVSGFNTTPTFVQNLYTEGKISHMIFGIYITSLSESGIPEGTGEITFGGVDQSRLSGDITWLPQNEPLDFHWEFNASTLSWGDKLLVTGPIYSRTDTGVLPIAIPSEAFFDILDDVPGTNVDSSSALEGCLIFPSNATANSLPPLEIGIGNLNFSIPASSYIVPPTLYSALNITADNMTHTFIAPGGFGAFDLGQKFLENAYSAYDMENHMIGFALLA
ncbi:uncharacterized protein FIBRA_01314 [Fibroporia radiculosa]|uniref:Peptidase A1 domain-containing protein n=1 Tax=Fibroporia radiculosa TaxID=599839 RepID=J4G0X2_9APHY|nr:uncharacterized protein FIBRA_01314 [Fibroporia radiculosa]CCL99298.1 predicted protein [Fibroporia radiculosa]